MSIQSDDKYKEEQYNLITDALETGKRVVYNKKAQKFESYSRSDAKKLSNNQYITDLPRLKEEVEKFVKTYGISNVQKTYLENAFDARAERLKHHWSHIFGGEERDKAAEQLEGFRSTIEKAATQHTQILAQRIPPSSPGPAKSNLTTPTPQTPKPSQPPKSPAETLIGPTLLSKSSTPSQPQKPSTEVPPPPSSKASPPGGPPPPPKGIGVPPPMQPAPSSAKGPTRAQQVLMKQRTLAKDEQKQPVLPGTVDAGKSETVKQLNESQKKQLKDDIDKYLNGTPIQSKQGTRRAKDGLKGKVKEVQGRLVAHTKALTNLAGPTKELQRLRDEKTTMEKRLEIMEMRQKEGVSFVFNTIKKDKESGATLKSTPIRYYSDSEIEALNQQFEGVSAEDKKNVKDTLSKEFGKPLATEQPIPKQRTLAYLIKAQKEEITKKDKAISEKNVQIQQLQKTVKDIEQEENGEIPFAQYKDYIQDRTDLIGKYDAINRWVGEVAKEKTEVDLQAEHNEMMMGNLPLLSEERSMLAQLGPQKRMVMSEDLSKLLNTNSIMTDEEIGAAKEKLEQRTSIPAEKSKQPPLPSGQLPPGPPGKPPPPPTPIKPPPPMMQQTQALPPGKGPSRAHQFLMKERVLAQGEQKQPTLPTTLDAGKNETIKQLSESQKKQLKDDIDKYLNGTPTQSKQGPSARRTKNGLKDKISEIENRLAAHAGALKNLAGPKQDLQRLSDEQRAMEKRLSAMENAQKSGAPYLLNTTTFDKETGIINKGTPITFYPNREINELNQQFTNQLTLEDQKRVKGALSKEQFGQQRDIEQLIPKQRTLSYLIDAQKKEIAKKKQEISEIKTQIQKLEKAVTDIETEKNGAIPFSEYSNYINDRKDLATRYDTIIRWMGETTQEKTGIDPQKEKQETIIDNLPLLSEERGMLAQLGSQKRTVMNEDLSALLNNDSIMMDEEIEAANREVKSTVAEE